MHRLTRPVPEFPVYPAPRAVCVPAVWGWAGVALVLAVAVAFLFLA